MSIFGTNVAQSVAGVNQAERVAARNADRKTDRQTTRELRDTVDLEARAVEEIDAIRSLKGNDQEETHQDRREKDGYRPLNEREDGEAARHIDVEG